MPDTFEGKATDGRQAAPAETVKPTRFRPRYRNLDQSEKDLHDAIKAKAEELEALYDQIGNRPAHPDRTTPFGRYKALALTSLEESVMWAVKELTA